MTHRVPGHLLEGSQTWLTGLRGEREWSATEWRILLLAAEAYDRASTARRTIAREGLTLNVESWQGSAENGRMVEKITAHPAAAIARDNAALFSKLTAQLGLDEPAIAAPAAPEKPAAPTGFLDELAARRNA